MCEAAEQVLSDVHLYRQPTTSVSSIPATKTVWRSEFNFSSVPFIESEDTSDATISNDVTVDEDGDFVITRKHQSQPGHDEENKIVIEHSMETPIEDVGLQVWYGALLMCDFILHNQSTFKELSVLELGAGVGLASIVMATVAKNVLCTDVGSDVLDICKSNIETNKWLYSDCNLVVRELDWKKETHDTDNLHPFHWTAEDLKILENEVSVILAADVIYDDDLTDAFFRTVHRLMSNGQLKTLYLVFEKRFNFTLGDLAVTCGAYDHFRDCLEFLQTLHSNKHGHFSVTQLPISSLPQYFHYQRLKEMELWKIETEKR